MSAPAAAEPVAHTTDVGVRFHGKLTFLPRSVVCGSFADFLRGINFKKGYHLQLCDIDDPAKGTERDWPKLKEIIAMDELPTITMEGSSQFVVSGPCCSCSLSPQFPHWQSVLQHKRLLFHSSPLPSNSCLLLPYGVWRSVYVRVSYVHIHARIYAPAPRVLVLPCNLSFLSQTVLKN